MLYLPRDGNNDSALHWGSGTLDKKPQEWFARVRSLRETGFPMLVSMEVQSSQTGVWPHGNGFWPAPAPPPRAPSAAGSNRNFRLPSPPSWEAEAFAQYATEVPTAPKGRGGKGEGPKAPKGSAVNTICTYAPSTPAKGTGGKGDDPVTGGKGDDPVPDHRRRAQSVPPRRAAAKGTGGKGDDPVPEQRGPADVPQLQRCHVPVVYEGTGGNIGKV